MATNTVNLSEFNKEELKFAHKFNFGIIVADWNKHITKNLSIGTFNTLIELGVKKKEITFYNVPGSFELIYAASQLCKSKKHDAIIVIGSIIKGETAHFDYICQGVTQGIKDLNILYNTPVIFCVLTDLNETQSVDRSGGKYGNKGVEAAVSAVKMVNLKKVLN
ncbi:MAG: 6,7-dimethyl-8-ribityllumazine synthase [Solirubrobacteraceae bacterium]